MTKPLQTTTPQRAAVLKEQGAAIAGARIKAGLTQIEAARVLGVTQSTVASWEQGRRGCMAETRRIIVKKWGGDPEILGPDSDCCPTCGRPWAW